MDVEIEIYLCDNDAALQQTLGALDGRADVLYQSAMGAPESGDIIRYLAGPPRSPAEPFGSFVNKLVVLARRAERTAGHP